MLNKNQKRKIEATEMKYLRRAMGLIIMNKIRNADTRETLEIKSVEKDIEGQGTKKNKFLRHLP